MTKKNVSLGFIILYANMYIYVIIVTTINLTKYNIILIKVFSLRFFFDTNETKLYLT